MALHSLQLPHDAQEDASEKEQREHGGTRKRMEVVKGWKSIGREIARGKDESEEERRKGGQVKVLKSCTVEPLYTGHHWGQQFVHLS